MNLEKIKQAEKKVNSKLNKDIEISIRRKMVFIKTSLKEELPEYDVICDDTNNSQSIIDSGYIFAKISDKSNDNFTNLIFLT